ncbi:MAG: hypothetical protein FWE05_04340 [Defluviitaleaceae bacterium]|nr:hypothetical protein [Defluviitaleaceae bacterium]
MKKLLRRACVALIATFFVMGLVACGGESETPEESITVSVENPQTATPNSTSESNSTPPTESEADDSDVQAFIEEYMDNISQTEDSHFYYNIWFVADNFPTIGEVPLDGLRAMYQELNERFNYIVILTQSLNYLGYYSGDERFVESLPFGNIDLRNRLVSDTEGNEFFITPLNTVMVGRTLFQYFDNNIVKGRNFIESDFYFNSPTDVINIILGYDYIGVYDLNDILTLTLYGKVISFRVIGFYGEGTEFPNMNHGFENIYFDRSIIMPLFAITYDPTSEDDQMFQIIHYSQKASGNIRISATAEELQEETFEIHSRYLAIIQEMADRHGLEHNVAALPIPRQLH